MIRLKSPDDIKEMAKAGALVGECLALVRDNIRPGVSTLELNNLVEEYIKKAKAKAAFKGYTPPGMTPFPSACCMSVDEQVVHGLPNETPLVEGQIVSVDIGVELNGWFGDAARTYIVGNKAASPEIEKLVMATEKALYLGIEKTVAGGTLGDIGYAIQSYSESLGYGVVRDMVGHGIGRSLHEEPQVPNYGKAGTGLKIRPGLVIAIEPMVNMGTGDICVLEDGWTVVTADHKPSAHFEHMVVVTEEGSKILTQEP